MKNAELKKYAGQAHWVLLGLVMLVPGLLKLFVMGSGAVSQMLGGIGFPAPAFFAWVLIIAEIVSGILILAKYKLSIVTWIPFVILVVAGLTVYWGQWPSVLIHLTVAVDYVMLGQR